MRGIGYFDFINIEMIFEVNNFLVKVNYVLNIIATFKNFLAKLFILTYYISLLYLIFL